MRTSLVLLAAVEAVTGFMVNPLAALVRTQQAVSVSESLVTARHVQTCVCMSCRNNLKKDKRVRNRVNAFRFKKGGFGNKKRFNNFEDRAVAALKATEDAAFLSLLYTHTAAAELEAAAAAEAAPKEQQTA